MAGRRAVMPPTATVAKRFYKIGDAARLVGVKPHVLRYWESEFPELRPLKTRGAHRMYGVEHLALARRIRELVQERGFTVQGARRQLRADGPAPARRPDATAGDEVLALRRELLALRAQLSGLLGALASSPRPRRKQLRVDQVGPANPGSRSTKE